MRTLVELVNDADPGWPLVLEAVHGAENHTRVLPTARTRGEAALLALLEHALRVAFDAIGGTFAINGGGLGPDLGKAYYFAPDSLEWEPLAELVPFHEDMRRQLA